MSAVIVSLDKGKIAQDAEKVKLDKEYNERLRTFVKGKLEMFFAIFSEYFRPYGTCKIRNCAGYCTNRYGVGGDKSRENTRRNMYFNPGSSGKTRTNRKILQYIFGQRKLVKHTPYLFLLPAQFFNHDEANKKLLPSAFLKLLTS